MPGPMPLDRVKMHATQIERETTAMHELALLLLSLPDIAAQARVLESLRRRYGIAEEMVTPRRAVSYMGLGYALSSDARSVDHQQATLEDEAEALGKSVATLNPMAQEARLRVLAFLGAHYELQPAVAALLAERAERAAEAHRGGGSAR